MVGTPEFLASFGGATFEAKTGCVTPVEAYGGDHWAFADDDSGKALAGAHLQRRNTLSFCFKNESYIQIYQKMLSSEAAVGPIPVGGSWMAWLLSFKDAGNGYSWLPRYLLDMSMK